jgi:ligand-binding SRPBCC domain-containing protein
MSFPGKREMPEPAEEGRRMAGKFVLRDHVVVHAPLSRCFRLSTSIEIVGRELRMHPVNGRTSGLVSDDDIIRWKGWKFGLPQFHESHIEDFRENEFFRDRMISGRFARFEHDHRFTEKEDGSVVMQEEIRFTMRWGRFGDLLGRRLVAPLHPQSHARAVQATEEHRRKRSVARLSLRTFDGFLCNCCRERTNG